MVKIGQLFYFLAEAAKNYRQNKAVSFLSTATIAISMLILGFFLLLYFNIGRAFEGWGNELKMVVYLADDAKPEETRAIKTYIEGRNETEAYNYISKKEALEDFKKRLGDSSIVEALSSNPLPASFVIQLKEKYKKSSSAEAFASALKTYKGVEGVDYGREWVEKFEFAFGLMRTVLLAFGGFLGLAVFFIVYNTMKLKVYSRAEEIEIMKLVGATDRFIKAPFVVEGVAQGFFSSSFAMAALYAINRFFIAKAAYMSDSFFALSSLPFIPMSYLLGLVLFSSFLGYVGSLVSVGKFLKV